MSDNESKALEVLLRGDHTRGCEGRQYTCSCGHDDKVDAAARVIATALESRDARIQELEGALGEARRAIGDHFAPSDCYATGPLTGDPYRDLVVCPACSFIATHDTILAKQEPKA